MKKDSTKILLAYGCFHAFAFFLMSIFLFYTQMITRPDLLLGEESDYKENGVTLSKIQDIYDQMGGETLYGRYYIIKLEKDGAYIPVVIPARYIKKAETILAKKNAREADIPRLRLFGHVYEMDEDEERVYQRWILNEQGKHPEDPCKTTHMMIFFKSPYNRYYLACGFLLIGVLYITFTVIIVKKQRKKNRQVEEPLEN